eukprot:620608-Amphidinium_carterae.1
MALSSSLVRNDTQPARGANAICNARQTVPHSAILLTQDNMKTTRVQVQGERARSGNDQCAH